MANGAATTSSSTGGTVSNPTSGSASGGTDWTGLESSAWNDAAKMVAGAYSGQGTTAAQVKKETKALAKVGSGTFAGIKSFLDHPLYLAGAVVLILIGIMLIIGMENTVNITSSGAKAAAVA